MLISSFIAGIHYENIAKMSNPGFVENELVPGVIRSMLSNKTEVKSLVSVIQQQYFGDLKDYSDSASFVPRFVEVKQRNSCMKRLIMF